MVGKSYHFSQVTYWQNHRGAKTLGLRGVTVDVHCVDSFPFLFRGLYAVTQENARNGRRGRL